MLILLITQAGVRSRLASSGLALAGLAVTQHIHYYPNDTLAGQESTYLAKLIGTFLRDDFSGTTG